MPTFADIAVHTICRGNRPGSALAVAGMAAFWLTCAATGFCGVYYGAVAFRRAMVHDGDTIEVIDLDHYRRRRRCRSHRPEPDCDEPA